MSTVLLRQSSTRRHESTKNDRFPLLDVPELSLCLKSCNLNAPEEDLYKPSPIFVQSLFHQILEIFLSISPNRIRHRLAKLLTDEEREEFEESMDLVTLQAILYKFFVDCGVYDFIITDLTRPDPQRIRRLLSAVVNFARFREEHLYDNESIIQENNTKFDKFTKVSQVHKNLSDNIEILQKNNDKSNANVDKLSEHNHTVEQELRSLKKIQEMLTGEHASYKNEKARLIKALEDHNYLLLESKKELEKMKSYVVESPEIISKIIEDMNNSLLSDQHSLSELEIRSRKLAVTIESFNIINSDLKNCLKIVEELTSETNKEHSAISKLNQYKESYEDKKLKLNDLSRKTQLITRQIKNNEEKTLRTTQQKEEKRLEYEKRMKELHDMYATIMTEKNLNDRELSKKKDYINSVQKKMYELENSFKREYDRTTLEIQRLNSHVKLYLDQIEEKLQL